MYIIDGVAYAGELKPVIKVSGVRPLKDVAVFNSVYIDYGIAVWLNGDIDISPNELYENGIDAEYPETA